MDIERQLEDLGEHLEDRENTFQFVKCLTNTKGCGGGMYHQIFLGVVDLAETVRPHGFPCYENHRCPQLKGGG